MIETGNPFDDIMRTIRGEGGGVTPPVPAASPTYPTAAPSVATTPPKSGGLTALLPVIAALIAAKRGGLPGYAGGMVDAQKSRQDLALKQGAAQRDQQQIDIARQRAEAETARYADEAQKEQLARQAAAKKFLEERVNRAFDNNPQLEDQVNSLGADKFSIPGPDGSNINLEQALGAIGAVRGPDGKYRGLGKKEKPSLTTSYEDPLHPDVGTRVPDGPGVKVKARARVPAAPKEPKEPVAAFKDDVGKPVKVTKSEVTAAMKQEGLDPSRVDELMQDPAALRELFSQ